MTADDAEQRLTIDLMTIQIERLRQEIRMENRKFAVQIILALVARSASEWRSVAVSLFHA